MIESEGGRSLFLCYLLNRFSLSTAFAVGFGYIFSCGLSRTGVLNKRGGWKMGLKQINLFVC